MTSPQKPATGYAMHRIKLEPARAPHADPAGDARGYEIVAPLDPTGLISVEGWRRERALCFVHRTEHGAVVERGALVHLPGGPEGATWAIDYDPGQEGDEERGYRFGSHAMKAGEYVSIREASGPVRTYRVASVTPA